MLRENILLYVNIRKTCVLQLYPKPPDLLFCWDAVAGAIALHSVCSVIRKGKIHVAVAHSHN